MNNKIIDIKEYKDFIDKGGFLECKNCGWALDKQHYADHDCKKMVARNDKLPQKGTHEL